MLSIRKIDTIRRYKFDLDMPFVNSNLKLDRNKVEADVAFWVEIKIRNVSFIRLEGDYNLKNTRVSRPPPPSLDIFAKLKGGI